VIKSLKDIKNNCRGNYQSPAGITLLSLVVTIVLMMILSGVAIYMGIGADGGVINAIKDETQYQEKAINEEKSKMNTVLKNQEKDWGIE